MNSSQINKLKYREYNNIEQVERGVNKKIQIISRY